MPSSSLILALLLVLSFAISTILEPRQQRWIGKQSEPNSALEVLLGDARKLFANHFFIKADVYFHSGYYPSMFDQAAAPKKAHIAEAEHHNGHDEAEHEKEMDFLGKPTDWIDRFGRHFFASTHSHLERPEDAGELLPWLKLSAELDPNRIETFTVTSFWLSTELHKIKEAKEFLREGWRANPDSYLIIMELGRLYYVYDHDYARARNLWELALKKWDATEPQKKEPDFFACEQILAHLADLEEKDNHLEKCIYYLERLQKLSPTPDVIASQIEDRKKALAPPANNK